MILLNSRQAKTPQISGGKHRRAMQQTVTNGNDMIIEDKQGGIFERISTQASKQDKHVTH